MKKLHVDRKAVKKPPVSVKTKDDTLIGKTVFFEYDGQRIAGVVLDSINSQLLVMVALPDANGILHKTGSEIEISSVYVFDAPDAILSDQDIKVKAWEAHMELRIPKGHKLLHIHDRDDEEEKGPIVDIQNVRLEGFLSTFASITPSDRDGDVVLDGAFNETLAEFRKNPVMLTDHTNTVSHLAGSFDKIGITKDGLAVSGRISNSPDMISTRFKVAEGHLKALSMGGLFFFDETGRGIERVDLFEGSLTPVPANQDALFQVRSLTIVDAAKAMKRYARKG